MREGARSSAVRRLYNELRKRHHDGIAQLPPNALSAWLRTILAGLAGIFILLFVLVSTAKKLQRGGRLEWEADFLRNLQLNGPLSFSSAVFFQTFGTDITLLILILLTGGIAMWMRRTLTAWTIALGYIVVDPLVRVGWTLWDRTRPAVIYEGIASPAFHSFPSGHTAKTVAVYGILALIWVRASHHVAEKICALVLLTMIAVVVPLGRLSMGVHWPTDIIAGWILGLFWLIVMRLALRFDTRR